MKLKIALNGHCAHFVPMYRASLPLPANARQDFEGYQVSTRVNSARNDFPELLERVAAQAGQSLQDRRP